MNPEEIVKKYEKNTIHKYSIKLKKEIRVINNTNAVDGSFSGALVMFHRSGRLQGKL